MDNLEFNFLVHIASLYKGVQLCLPTQIISRRKIGRSEANAEGGGSTHDRDAKQLTAIDVPSHQIENMKRITTSRSLKILPRKQRLEQVDRRCNRYHPMRTLLQLHRPAPLATTTSYNLKKAISEVSCRYYTRVIYQYPSKKVGNGNGDTSHDIPELLPPSPRTRSNVVRFINPWVDLSHVTDDAVLAQKVDSVTRTFGVVAGLMCSLSAAALAVIPSADEEHSIASKNNGIRSGKKRDDLVKESQSDSATINVKKCSTGVDKGSMIRHHNTQSMYNPNKWSASRRNIALGYNWRAVVKGIGRYLCCMLRWILLFIGLCYGTERCSKCLACVYSSWRDKV